MMARLLPLHIVRDLSAFLQLLQVDVVIDPWV